MNSAPTIVVKPCPNLEVREGYRPTAVVLHIMEGTLGGCDAWFANPNSQVSAHYGVGKGGELHNYVAESMAAWHAGVVDRPTWPGLRTDIDNPNLYTLGIECEGHSGEPWTPEQAEVVIWLLRKFWADYDIIPSAGVTVVRHSAINAGHSGCPGLGCPLEIIVLRASAAGPLGV